MKTVSKILIFLVMIFTLSSCAANRKLAAKKKHAKKEALPKDTVFIKTTIDCPDAVFSKDTANQYGKVNVNISDGDLNVEFNCDACAHELDSVYHEYNLLNDLFNEQLNKPVVYKIKNSFNETTKNSNNSTEITKLKNAIQIRDSKLDSVSFKNIALQGKVKELEKELTKNKNSNSGSGTNSAKSGNTTNKAPWYVWLIVFICGWIFGRVFPMIIKKIFPALNIFSFIKNRFV